MSAIREWLKSHWVELVAGVVGILAIAIGIFQAGARAGVAEGKVIRSKQRAARAVRYSQKRANAIATASRDARRREEITKPNRSDWDELRKKNAELDGKEPK